MNARVVKLYDLASVTVPKEMTAWQVTDAQVEEQLVLLRKLAAQEISAEKAEAGDCVVCACDHGALAGRTVLLYPGQKIPSAESAEETVLGLSAGAAFTADLNGEVSLKVQKVIRRQASQMSDELIAGLGIEGVSTVAAYRAWYIQQTSEDNKAQALKSIKIYILTTLAERSEFEIDEAELDTWAMGQIEEIKKVAPEMLGNPDDYEIMLPMLKEQVIENFKQELVMKAFCESRGFTFTPDMFADKVAETLQQAADMPGMEMDETQCAEMLVNNAYVEQALNLLDETAQAALEG